MSGGQRATAGPAFPTRSCAVGRPGSERRARCRTRLRAGVRAQALQLAPACTCPPGPPAPCSSAAAAAGGARGGGDPAATRGPQVQQAVAAESVAAGQRGGPGQQIVTDDAAQVVLRQPHGIAGPRPRPAMVPGRPRPPARARGSRGRGDRQLQVTSSPAPSPRSLPVCSSFADAQVHRRSPSRPPASHWEVSSPQVARNTPMP